MVRVKLCGFTRQADVTRAVEAGVDAVGAIVDVPVETPRAVEVTHAARLFAAVPPFVSTVLVTMPESADRARELIDRVDPDAIQVHAGLAPAAVEALAEETSAIAAVGHDEPAIKEYADAADGLLVDSTDESGAGGTGQTHDWTATRELTQLDTPIVLAGGLTPENVRSAVTTVGPYAVDAASGVEAEPGQKDAAAMDQFVAAARGRD
ncbi:phosphoribosylanthranilate isomerase [Halodesulfurarchaeum formicicum]|uniref:N-(5'-phosphoribosyl)anthranilate isomerase n=1 Tax=Halodesulfurarchaeum formicicum TaxID=1873524 RepID=A0A1D8S2U9_9EURY|nr:phosphoribosylanthranilate isomerase [Halodesulfurarchaeum formicicum]AOW79676.1 phosphoribosylanthranilate isomerase [Halodesulfurarchaeum formicicum]